MPAKLGTLMAGCSGSAVFLHMCVLACAAYSYVVNKSRTSQPIGDLGRRSSVCVLQTACTLTNIVGNAARFNVKARSPAPWHWQVAVCLMLCSLAHGMGRAVYMTEPSSSLARLRMGLRLCCVTQT